MVIAFSKILTKTDVEKRLSVPTVKKKCFLNFGGQHKVEFKAKDKNGRVWSIFCSTRKNKGYPKPVLCKGWLQFVHCWKLAIGDEVIFHRKQDKAGKGYCKIDVIKRATQRSSVLSPPVQNHDADRTMAVASYSKIEEEPSTTSYSTDQAITHVQTEGLHNQPVTDRDGLTFEFISLVPHIKVGEPKLIDFFELGSQEQSEKELPGLKTTYHMVEIPTTSSTAPYFVFL